MEIKLAKPCLIGSANKKPFKSKTKHTTIKYINSAIYIVILEVSKLMQNKQKKRNKTR